MAQTKYGKYIVSYPKTTQSGPTADGYQKENEIGRYFGFLEDNISLEYTFYCDAVRISPPCKQRKLYKFAHIHDLEEVMLFLSIGPDSNLGGDIEIYLGSEGEIHTFNSNTIIYIPKSFKQCPI
jgi:hypothetical protein